MAAAADSKGRTPLHSLVLALEFMVSDVFNGEEILQLLDVLLTNGSSLNVKARVKRCQTINK